MDLQKDLSAIMNQKKQLLCTDINHSSTIYLTSYNIVSGNTSESTASFIMTSIADIIEATETEITLSNTVTFKTPDIVTGVAPNETTTPGDVIVCAESIKITLDSLSELNLNYKSLVGRRVGAFTSNPVSISISSGKVVVNSSASINYVLLKDLELESIFNNYINSLNSENPKQLLKSDFPNPNSFFNKYDDFTDVLIGYKGCYKETTHINNIVGESNDFLKIDIDEFLSKDDFQEHFDLYNTQINNFYREHDEWVAYFAKLKKLIAKMKISDAMVDEEECENLFDSKGSESQNDIMDMYNVYLENNREVYTENKQSLLYDIKI